jgi:DNA-binding transcriptional LysR family regulator
MDATSDLRVFVRVMDRGSFSSAAKDLGLTPSAVSKLVSRLEDRLGVRLLERSTRRLALTPEGETFLARARRIVADIDEAEAEVARVRGAPRGRLRINSGTAFGLHQLAPALADFLSRYPEIDVELSITDRLVDLIEEQADIAVRSYRTVSPLPRLLRDAPRRSVLCGTIPEVQSRSTRAFSPPDIIRHRLSMEPGLSSPPAFRHWRGAAVRPTDKIGMGWEAARVKRA